MPKYMDKVEGYLKKVFRPKKMTKKEMSSDPSLKKAGSIMKGRGSQLERQLKKSRGY